MRVEGINRSVRDAKTQAAARNQDAFGIMMISHGEDFGDDSAFGTSLVKAIAKLPPCRKRTPITSRQNFIHDIKDYEHQRKKPGRSRTRRTVKRQHERERQEAEDGMSSNGSCPRYEENCDDVDSRMQVIQENETTKFLNLELNFTKQYILQSVGGCESELIFRSTLAQFETQHKSVHPHVFSRIIEDGKLHSVRSTRSRMSNASGAVASSDGSVEGHSPSFPTRRVAGRRQ
ncbi:uncharacterized protein EDB91DRAFT_1080502 [Suillus paluster]|uniref:uncharacterized protein n=1 Tax=Suillus paluster TaxID=48578 RepID=UPI001B875B5C|nr:uncharacterized protein EDB91DRAFT_1080502 [Suillus paluster]KAG1744973.1 hypothetical protein EDB91DRAFT_1080502 [Suillus paluster]